jgi:uncharacterized protein YbjQ (UPF0145 family)
MKLLQRYSIALGFALLTVSPFPISAAPKEKPLFDVANGQPPSIFVTTTMGLEGYRITDYKGIVRGVTVRQPTVSQSLKANLKGIVGGKISPFTTMCETARQQALDILVERAQAVGANAVVGMRYDSSAFGDSNDMGTEVVCYGTAVVVEPIRGDSKQASRPGQQAAQLSSDDNYPIHQ